MQHLLVFHSQYLNLNFHLCFIRSDLLGSALVWRRTVAALGADVLAARGVTGLEVSVAEAPTQEARYRRALAAFGVAEAAAEVVESRCAAFAVAP